MNSIKNSLTRKIGPLPAWAWLAGLGVIIYVIRKRQAAANQNAAAQSDVPFVGPYGEDAGPGGPYTNQPSITPQPAVPPIYIYPPGGHHYHRHHRHKHHPKHGGIVHGGGKPSRKKHRHDHDTGNVHGGRHGNRATGGVATHGRVGGSRVKRSPSHEHQQQPRHKETSAGAKNSHAGKTATHRARK